jgi:hypothetical protein
MAELQKLNHRHEAIINWLLANPEKNLGDCAKAFGYTQPWLSQVIHSDMFQALYRQRATELGGLVVHDIRTKLNGLAVAAVAHSQLLIESGNASQDFVLETTKNVLDRLGYAPPARGAGVPQSGSGGTQITINVTAEELVAARSRAQEKRFGASATIEALYEVPSPAQIEEGPGSLKGGCIAVSPVESSPRAASALQVEG